ncbi:MAG TPA: TIGR02391 family protein, partial [Thermoanaerobaculia bacterium]|nr:TIGR02391 family protein [Thermoanaerobaculia bacterium]
MNVQAKVSPRLWEAIRANYENSNFTGAILDAMHFLSDTLREKAGVESDGVALTGEALGGKSPRIKVNKLQSDSDWNIQRGVEQIV